MLREARGGLTATVGNRVSYYLNSFLFFSVCFSQNLVFPGSLCSEAFQHILDAVGISQAEVRRTYLKLFDSHCYSLMKTNLRIIRHIKTLKILLATTIWPTTQCHTVSLKYIRPYKTEIIVEKSLSHHPRSNLQHAAHCDYCSHL